MKRRLVVIFLTLFMGVNAMAQKGIIQGVLTEEQNNQQVPLPFANVYFEGTTLGTTSDFDGNFSISTQPGSYVLIAAFMGYETFKKEVEVTAGGTLTLTIQMKPEGIAIEGVEVVAKMNRESEVALILEQKNAGLIKESIGAQQLSSMGVSDAAAASTKISGVTKSEGSSEIYIRGLGDRYLLTTMNGLPIPSDDVDKKNIDLNLFPTEIIENLGISKTNDVTSYADQTSGQVDISSKNTAEKLTLSLTSGTNTNVLANGFGAFKATQNFNDLTFGFYQRSYSTNDAVSQQSWNTLSRNLPLNYGFSLAGGKQITAFGNNLSFFATLSHDASSDYSQGIFKKYRSNVLDNSFTDVEEFETRINTTGLINLAYQINDRHRISFNSMWLFKTSDNLYEQGRNGDGYVFDQDPSEYGAFVRDQNLKQTRISINQLLGTHELDNKNKVYWALAYNRVKADEPNRIRNEFNLMNDGSYQFAHVGDFQQRKSQQNITDAEFTGFIKNEFRFIDNDNSRLTLNSGADFRSKQRDFNSLFMGVRAKGVRVESADNLDEALLNEDLYLSGDLMLRERPSDSYLARLGVYAAYVNIDFLLSRFSGNLGLRYERDQMNVDWDVANYVGRVGAISYTYENLLPALNLKYQLSDKSALRLAGSKTITLPEFKELAPFEYVSPVGRITKGNPDLESSKNYNFDAKWEIFPRPNELISLAAFYKVINQPINLTQTRGSSGNFIYENTGEKAEVYGLEFEARIDLIESVAMGKPGLKLNFNATKMWFSQDLLEEFQYNNKTSVGLQGASDFIVNGSLSFSSHTENEFTATLTANYASDNIFALGSPEDFINSATLFNSEIIEKGFVSLDVVLTKKLSDRVSVKLYGKNLLNPDIEQTQEIKSLNNGQVTNEVVMSYKKGIRLGLGVNINLN
ncbi:MAG: TonB-dependent receptor [Salinivirgaceae bacterium]